MTIRTELEGRLAAFAAAQSPPLQVAWEGMPFVKPTTPWLECFLASAGTICPTVDGTRTRERGTLSINVWVPNGQGAGKSDSIAQALMKAFPVVPKQGTVSIEQPGNTSRIILDVSGWIMQPISFQYRCDSVA